MAARIQSLRNGIDPVDEMSRDDLVSGDVVVVTSLDAATTYNWTLVFVPEGSTATFSGVDTAVSPGSFTVDLEGPYLVRLVVDVGLPTEDTQYVRLRALTAFGQLHLVAAGERRDGTGIIPVDVDAEGWANEQNENIVTLKDFIKPIVSSGRLLYVDANDGTTNYADHSTIQAAITAATSAGASESEQWVIAVRPGRYVETVTFAPWVHVFGWPGNPDGETSEAVVLEGIQTATTAVTTDRILIADIQIENNANSILATLTKTGLGTVRLKNTRIESNGTQATQGPALSLTGGRVEAVGCYLQHTSAGTDSRQAFTQSGTSTGSLFQYCVFEAPSGVSLNPPGFVLGIQASFLRCRVISSDAAGIGIATTAEALDFQYGSVETVSGDAIVVNPTAGVFAGPVRVTVCYSALETDLTFDVTNIGGTTTLEIGAVKYTNLNLPGGAVTTQTALAQSKSHYYDNSVTGITAENVQDAIDEIAGAATISFLVYNKNLPEVPNDSVSFRGWSPVAAELIAIRVRMMTVNTQGTYSLTIENEGTGNTVLGTDPFPMNTLVAGTITAVALTAVPADLIFASLDGWNVTLTSDDPNFDGSDVYIELVFDPSGGGGGGPADWATVLLIGNVSGGTNPTLTPGDVMVFGSSPAAPVSSAGEGRFRYNQPTTSFQVSVDGGAWTDIGGGGGSPFIHKAVPPLPNNTWRYEGWTPIAAVVGDISVAMETVNTQGTYSATFTNETTGNTMLIGATFDMNTVVANTVTPLTLTGAPADLSFAAGDQWSVEFTSDDLAFDGNGIYWSILFGTTGSIVITGAPDDNEQFEMTIFPANTINTLWFAPYACELVGVRVYGQTSPATSGIYTLAVEDIDNSNNLLAAATFDMTTLTAATLTTLPLTGTLGDRDLAVGTRVRMQLISDNVDLTASGIYIQLIYRSQ